MLFRRLVELACRKISFWRRLPAEFGRRPIMASPDAALRWLRVSARAFDAHLLDIGRDVRPDDIVWDIGANVGLFSLIAAHQSQQPVLAIEADKWLAGLIERTARANADRQLSIVSVAIGARPGVGEFAVASRGRSANGLISGVLSTQTGGAREVRAVRVETLDGLLRNRAAPSLVKIDIEGGELDALRGADRLLREVRPRIIVEIAAANFDLVRELLAGYRYTLRRVEGDNFEATHEMEPGGAQECRTGERGLIVPSCSINEYATPLLAKAG
ncbi:MAG: FkbM family methyltransferase [Sphingomonas sp.]|uniref:FkbM family methyltransferase n=1 Tax=Sphingomonas sp. TaxID=28214 RepID=UPI001AD483A5|nr:FkbM family methyltransferase [Sphingomonas sp.]MBN8807629.1 FkbM family methyltransferase [Sphingomonas sp.]